MTQERKPSAPLLTPLVASLPATVPFVGPEAQERARGAAFTARLGANENVFGPSPRAISAMAASAQDAWMYADPEAHDLRRAIAAAEDVAPANVMIGEGIDGLLGLLVRICIAPGDVVVTSKGAYPTFNYHVAGFGGRLETVPYKGDAEDPEALLALARETGAKLVYLANPDNPMGSHHPSRVIEAMIERMPEGCLLVLDEAYVEFAPEGTAAQVDPEDGRVIRMRTFSKAYGLAGARVGYALGSTGQIAAFDRVRNHFGMGRISLAGALAALQDQAWLDTVRAEVAASRARIGAIAAAQGLSALPSATNFVTIDLGGDGALARATVAALSARGIFVRMPFVAPQDRCIRVSCGREADLDAFEAALPGALAEARAARAAAE
ncbi:pyridoxal phosphate-dependent aminotransferase [Frigidibacter sp. MR17.14]|uniref:pyridoxal phosphate-dependent aminotransferase n=1 Tax=Frigidibacter sp. MR17.14 TaxID=3126509 RepID=UPI0030131350